MIVLINVFLWWYGFHVFVSRFAGTCTQGDTDRFVMGAIFAVPAALIVVSLIYFKRFRVDWFTALNIVLVSVISVYFWYEAMYWTTILGNHICFLDWGTFEYYPDTWLRLIPLIYIVIAFLLTLSLVINFKSIIASINE